MQITVRPEAKDVAELLSELLILLDTYQYKIDWDIQVRNLPGARDFDATGPPLVVVVVVMFGVRLVMVGMRVSTVDVTPEPKAEHKALPAASI